MISSKKEYSTMSFVLLYYFGFSRSSTVYVSVSPSFQNSSSDLFPPFHPIIRLSLK